MFVLSNGSTKRQFATSLTAALLLSGVGATIVSAEPIATALSNAPESTESATAITSNHSSTTGTTSLASNTPSSSLQELQAELTPESNRNILVHAHEIDGRRAATLFVKNIPVLTFIGTEIDSLSNGSNAVSLAANNLSVNLATGAEPTGDVLNAALELDPVLRASTLGEKLTSGEVDATALSVRWNEESDEYIVTLADEDLIALDSRTVLPDTTTDVAEDALQVTNRLRRLLGDADPVSEIEGLPEPEPVVEVAPVQQVAIVSSNVGSASWYGPGFNGRLSASGEVFQSV